MAQVVRSSPVASMVDSSSLSPPMEHAEPLPNPHFVFPALPTGNTRTTDDSELSTTTTPSSGFTNRRAHRPTSLQPSTLLPPPPPSVSSGSQHRRGLSSASRRSANALPDFSFNPTAPASTLPVPAVSTPPASPTPSSPTTPTSRSHHRRGGSEYIGANEKGQMAELVSTSPQKDVNVPLSSSAPPTARLGPPHGRRGHAHRRSGAMSMTSQDMKAIMKPLPGKQASSAPTTPMEHDAEPFCTPAGPRRLLSQPSLPQIEDTSPGKSPESASPERPSSRARVGFSDNVEFIPRRPLSTISSETESSMTNHSASGSLSSLLSTGPASPGSRLSRSHLSTTIEEEGASTKRPRTAEALPSPRMSLTDASDEGDYLFARPASFSTMPRPTTEELAAAAVNATEKPRKTQKRRSILGFGTRKPEPSPTNTVTSPAESVLLSPASVDTVTPESLQVTPTAVAAPRLLDTGKISKKPRKVKSWTRAIRSKKPKTAATDDVMAAEDRQPHRSRSLSDITARPPTPRTSEILSADPEEDEEEIGAMPFVDDVEPVTEVSLDAVDLEDLFNHEEDLVTLTTPTTSQFPQPPSGPQSAAVPSGPAHPTIREPEEDAAIDLDEALAPYPDPPRSPGSRGARHGRKRMHSSRPDRELTFSLRPSHRRAESAPEYSMPPFFRNSNLSGSVVGSDMEDVFEEEEEEDQEVGSSASTPALEVPPSIGPGIQVTDVEEATTAPQLQSESEPDDSDVVTPPAKVATVPHVSPIPDSPSPLEIVEHHEEPRDGSEPRSSDSTVTSIVSPTAEFKDTMRPVPFNLNIPQYSRHGNPPSITESSISSPGFSPYQSSFETPRLGTAASSVTDRGTVSSIGGIDYPLPLRPSVDDVPSLTSSRSTMTSHIPSNRHSQSMRNLNERALSQLSWGDGRPESAQSERRRKRSSIVSLSRLVSGNFGEKSKLSTEMRPSTEGSDSISGSSGKETPKRKKEKRLSRLMFWKSKSSTSNSHSNVA